MHKIYLGTAPTKISTLFEYNQTPNYNTRRDPEFFYFKKSRLTALDKTLPFKGPKLYNHIVNMINKGHTSEKLERKFLNPFKSFISRYLNDVQRTGDVEWDSQNFALYSV